MEIIKIHYRLSKPVEAYKEIKGEVEKLKRFIVSGKFQGYYNKAFALPHSVVSETPFAFFIVAPEVMAEKMFKAQVVVNPEVIEAKEFFEASEKDLKDVPDELKKTQIQIPNIIDYQEPCMCFPFRQPKKIKRYNRIKVRYQIPTLLGGLKTVEDELQGIASEIFQHDTDHINGKNIYFESESPVKWWELIGTPRSKGGTSLDDPDELGLKRAKENAV
jgi:hypothetical protein